MDFIIKSYKKGEFLLEFRKADILGVRVAALTMGEACENSWKRFMTVKKPHLIGAALFALSALAALPALAKFGVIRPRWHRLFLFGLYLDAVETFAKYTNYLRLRNEGRGVNALNDAENIGAFALFGQHNEHFALFLRVPALSVQHRYATMGGADGGSNFIELFRENKELY